MKLEIAYRKLVAAAPWLRESDHPCAGAFAGALGRSSITILDPHHPAGRFAIDGFAVNTLACVRLSGRLGLCRTVGDLLDAAAHYFRHLSDGRVYTMEDFVDEVNRVTRILLALDVIRPDHLPIEVA